MDTETRFCMHGVVDRETQDLLGLKHGPFLIKTEMTYECLRSCLFGAQVGICVLQQIENQC